MPVIEGARSRIEQMHLGSPAAPADAAVLNDTELADGEATDVTEGLADPDVPRNVTVTGDDAGISGDVVVEGTDLAGEEISETIALSGTSTVAGDKAFKTVTKVTLPQRQSAGDNVRVGVGAKLGLHEPLERDTIAAAYHDGNRETLSDVTVAVDGDNLAENTIDLDSTLNESEVVVEYWRP